MPDVVALPTGAWFDPLEPGVPGTLELAGNPNVLTRDEGTSSLAQGPSAHTCLVEVERSDVDAPTPAAYYTATADATARRRRRDAGSTQRELA